MLSKRDLLLAVALSVLFLAVPVAVNAQQVASGSVTGTVTDASGAVVVSADVILTDISTKGERKLLTNADGHYIFVNVPPGTYDLRVTKTGFRTGKITGQAVNVGLTLTLNLRLEVGATTEVVEVKAEAGAELQTLNSTVGQTITGVALESLPSITRDLSTFAVLQPGVAPNGAVAGAVYDQNTFLLDGGQNTSDMDGGMTTYTPSFGGDPSGLTNFASVTSSGAGGVPTGVIPTPIDSIEEFKVSTTQQTADFNSSAGSQVTMVTKRGHDAWHGTVYEYYLDNNWDANSFTNNANTPIIKIPDYHYNRFGAAGGGPIIPKKILGGKTYFFANYEGFRWPNSVTLTRYTPGPGLRDGLIDVTPLKTVYNLNPTTTTYMGPSIGDLVQGTPYPSAGTQAACITGGAAASCDPRGLGVSPTMQALWALMPPTNDFSKPGVPGAIGGIADGVNIQGFIGNVALPQREDFAVVRIDHDFSEKEHFFASYRFYRETRSTDNQTELTAANGGQILALESRPQVPSFFVAGLTSNITSNFTNDFHYNYLRNWWLWGDQGGLPQGNPAICGTGAACTNLTGLSAALEGGSDSTSLTNFLNPVNVNNQATRTRYWDGQDHMVRDDMTRLLGNHVLQWGGIYEHNYNQHSRDDNGGSVNEYPTYVLANTSAASDNAILMQGGSGATAFNYYPTGITQGTSTGNDWAQWYAETLGILSIDQYVASRAGSQLTLQPPLTPVVDRVNIPYYNVYFTDSWHIKPTVTLTYGLAWTLEMPPTEQNGEQVVLVNDANEPIYAQQFLNSRKDAALQGNVYNPTVGFSLVGNAAGGLKYPYNPYYGQFSPRLAVAWSPNFDHGILGDVVGRNKTVVRGGFSIIYGRLNGVDLVLVPLLGYGLLQSVQCFNPASPTVTGLSGNALCGGVTPTFSPAQAFRVGPTGVAGNCAAAPCWDGLTAPLAQPATPPCAPATLCTNLPQPAFPGVNSLASGSVTVTDPNFRPNKSYEMDFTIQRQIGSRWTVEAGYIGRIIRNEFQPIELNSVPYMMTLTCPAGAATCTPGAKQSFAKAYANLVMQYCGGQAGLAGGFCGGPTKNVVTGAALTPQPFFETALAGTGYCTGYASCTAAVAAKEGVTGRGNLADQYLWNLWSDLDNGGFNFPHTMENTDGQFTAGGFGDNTSLGYGNYNALFISSRTTDWHGLTAQSNFTYGKALGLGDVVQASSSYAVPDSFDLGRGYGPQAWDRKFIFNSFLVYQPPYYKGQHGVVGHLLGGWTIAPIFSTGSGLPVFISSRTGADFGSDDEVSFGSFVQAVPIPGCSFEHSLSTHYHVPGTTVGGVGYGTSGKYAVNLFTNPEQSALCFRNPVLGFDNGSNGGEGDTLRGLPFWNVDMQIRKTTNITERVSGEFQVVFANMFNHMQLGAGGLSVGSQSSWGIITSQANAPREFEFGFRLRF